MDRRALCRQDRLLGWLHPGAPFRDHLFLSQYLNAYNINTLLMSLTQVHQHPYRGLAVVFVLWKFLLLSVACLSPGLGYDTSTDLLFELNNTANDNSREGHLFLVIFKHISAKLVRWDAIYFISSAKHGYVHEQEWAFGWGVTTLIGHVAKYCMQEKLSSTRTCT